MSDEGRYVVYFRHGMPSIPVPGHVYTMLDRLHAAMLLWKHGELATCRAVIAHENRRGPGFLKLANLLTPLYPAGSDDRRMIEGLLLASRSVKDRDADALPADWRAAFEREGASTDGR